MRVLHVQRSSGIGGSERHLLSLLPGLAGRGVEVVACVPSFGEAGRFTTALRDAGVDVVTLPAGGDLSPASVAGLARVIRRVRPDLVHTHLIHADVHGQVAAALTRTPAVSSVHSMHGFYLRAPYRLAAAGAGRLARRTIAISQAVADFLVGARVVPPGKVRVVHYGIDAAAWAGDDERAAFGFGPDDVVVGVASRLIPGKGHAALVEAVAEAGPGLLLLVAGDGPVRAEIEALAARLLPPGTARFVGFQADVGRVMRACDVVAFPTQPELREGFGLAALEAMAAGRPVVATRVGPLPEIVADGETGFVVDPTVPALAAALAALARDPARRAALGDAARRRAADRFGLDRMVDGTLAVYAEALAAPAPRSGGGNTPF